MATNALGSGSLSVMPLNIAFPENDGPTPLLTVSADDIIIDNDIYLGTDLAVGDRRDFTLTGDISGAGELYIGSAADSTLRITLAGNNTHTGGTYIAQNSTAIFNHNNAAGMGTLGFGSSGGSAVFNTANPIIYGLQSYDTYSYLSLDATAPRTLTINQTDYGYFRGNIDGSGASTIIKQGAGTLQIDNTTLSSSGIDSGNGRNVSLDIQEGTFLIGSNTNLGSGAIQVSGGTLAINHGSEIYNDVHVDEGRLAGSGNYYSSVYINSGGILSPGFSRGGQIGKLDISHLELGSGGIYEFNIQAPDSEGGHTGHISSTEPI